LKKKKKKLGGHLGPERRPGKENEKRGFLRKKTMEVSRKKRKGEARGAVPN